MSPPTNQQDSPNEETRLLPLNTPLEENPNDRARDLIVTFIKTGFAVTIAIIVFQWANISFNLSEKIGASIKRITIEFWIGTAISASATYWHWRRKKEAERAAASKIRAATNAEAIKALTANVEAIVKELNGRTESLMLQIAAIRASQAENSLTIAKLDQDGRALNEKIDLYRYEVLTERLELVKKFYKELSNLQSGISYLKGQEQGEQAARSLEALYSIVKSINDQINQFNNQINQPKTGESEEETLK